MYEFIFNNSYVPDESYSGERSLISPYIHDFINLILARRRRIKIFQIITF